MNNNTQKTGTVKFFNSKKGFGFIIDDESKEEIFVHISGIINKEELFENNHVQFETEKGKKGINAINVEKI